MTDADLAALKPGDRVLASSPGAFPPVACVVTRVDRRTVYLREEGGGLETARTASELILAPPDPPPLPSVVGDAALRSLESRWRALTDEMLRAIGRLVTERGCSLDALAVQFSVDDDGAQAGIWRLDLEGGVNVPENPVAICSVWTMLGKVPAP